MFGLGFHVGFARLYRPVCTKIQLEADASNDHKHQSYSSKFEHLFGCHLLWKNWYELVRNRSYMILYMYIYIYTHNTYIYIYCIYVYDYICAYASTPPRKNMALSQAFRTHAPPHHSYSIQCDVCFSTMAVKESRRVPTPDWSMATPKTKAFYWALGVRQPKPGRFHAWIGRAWESWVWLGPATLQFSGQADWKMVLLLVSRDS